VALEDAKDYCTAKGWTFNAPLIENSGFGDRFQKVLSCFRGELVYSEQLFKIRYRDLNYESVVMALDENDIFRSGDVESSLSITIPDMMDRPNTVNATYLTADAQGDGFGGFQPAEYVYSDQDAIAADGDQRTLDLKVYGLNSVDLVQPMAYYTLERARLGLTASGLFGGQALALEPIDLVTLSHDFPGWDAVTFRVMGVDLQDNGSVALQLMIEAENLYDDEYNLNASNFDTTTLPSPNDAVPEVENITLTEVVYTERLRSRIRLTCDFDAPTDYPWFDHVEVWVSVGGTDDYRYQFSTENNFFLDPVEEGENYYIKLRSVNIWGLKMPTGSEPVVNKIIDGKSATEPDNLSQLSATVMDDTVYVKAEIVSSENVEAYEFRISDATNSAWEAAVFLAANRVPVWQMTGMRSGTFRIFCSPKGTNNQYSATPVSTTFTVGTPHGWTLLQTEDIDYDDAGDSHDDTEFVDTGSGEYSLRVDHTSALTGTYTSREIDLGSSQTVRVQASLITSIIDSSVTWAALFGLTGTWDDYDMSEPWSSMFGISAPSRIEATLKWGTSTGVYTSEQDLFELMAVTATGRYFQVEITITDPNGAQYLYLDGPDADTVAQIVFYT
jgi:hypothetical protein